MGSPFSAGRPFTGAWIETRYLAVKTWYPCVAPSRGRGLKHLYLMRQVRYNLVAPSRGRGLKRNRKWIPGLPWCRPFTGAWIETTNTSTKACAFMSPLHGGVD